MDVNTGWHVRLSVPSGRRLAFKAQCVHQLTQARLLDPNARSMARSTVQLGKVDTCVVGYRLKTSSPATNLRRCQPGGYRAPVYDSTVSVIDLTFKEIQINVAINIQKMSSTVRATSGCRPRELLRHPVADFRDRHENGRDRHAQSAERQHGPAARLAATVQRHLGHDHRKSAHCSLS